MHSRVLSATTDVPTTHQQALSTTAGEIAARLDRLPACRTMWGVILLLSLGAFFEYFELFSTAYVMPGMIRSGLLTATTEGFVGLNGTATYIAATYGGLLIGVLAFGPVSSRYGRRTIFTFALLWYSITSLIMAMQTSAIGLNGWRLATGVGLGFELVTIDAYLTELVPVRIRGRGFAINKFVSFVAAPVVALLAFLLVPIAPLGIDGWRWVVAAGACGALLVWVIRLGLPESPRWLASQGRLTEAAANVSALEARVTRETGKPLPPPAKALAVPEVENGRFAELWSGMYLSRTLMLVVFNAAQAVAIYGFTHWMPTFLLEQGVELSKSLQIGVVFASVAPLGPIIALVFADRIERKWQIVGGALMVCVAGMAFVAMRGTWPIIVTGSLVAIGVTFITVGSHAYQAELYPTRNRGKALSLMYAVSRVLGMCSGFLIAAALKGAGVPGAMLLIAGCMLVVVLAVSLFGPKTRGRSLEEISH